MDKDRKKFSQVHNEPFRKLKSGTAAMLAFTYNARSLAHSVNYLRQLLADRRRYSLLGDIIAAHLKEHSSVYGAAFARLAYLSTVLSGKSCHTKIKLH